MLDGNIILGKNEIYQNCVYILRC